MVGTSWVLFFIRSAILLLSFNFIRICGDHHLLLPLVRRSKSITLSGTKRNWTRNIDDQERRGLLARGPMARLRDYSDNQYVGTIGASLFRFYNDHPLIMFSSYN